MQETRGPNGDEAFRGPGHEDLPKFVCVTIPPAPAKVAKVTSKDAEDLTGIAKEDILTWIDYVADDFDREALIIARKFGFSERMAKKLVEDSYEAYEDLDSEMGMVMPAIQIKDVEVDVKPIIILVKKNLIITVHDRSVTRLVQFSRYADGWMSKLPVMMPTVDKLTLVLARIIGVNNERNFEQLRQIEDRADDISEALLDPTMHYMETGRYIYEVKHGLINYLTSLWRCLDLLNQLRYGDAELISDNQKVLQNISNLATNVNKHISLTEHMSEVLVSGTTMLQTLHNNQLLIINNRLIFIMTWMTIIGTMVLVPNTIATVIGYMYTVPEEHFVWTMAVIIGATGVCTFLVYYWIYSHMQLAETPEKVKGTSLPGR
ncbi:MAG: CorA family divalent cation transporter [Euryarchaeota archaeon]|nr:CorA family divalent cation transporter [Euryarchaeota archaeon]